MKIKFKLLFALVISVAANILCLGQIKYNDADWGVHPMEYSRVGTAGWQFLKLPTNARSAAMGGIISSLSYGDANSALTNPASIADVKDFDFAISRMNWIADISYQAFSIVKNFQDFGIFGINVIYLDYADMERTENMPSFDGLGNNIGVLPVFDGRFGTFTASDLAIGLSYSRQITDKLQVGGSFKYIQETLDDAKTGNWSLDIGTLYYTGLNSLRLSFVGKNFGPDGEFGKYNERIQVEPIKVKMPMFLVMGAAYDIIDGKDDNTHKLIAAAEYIKPNDGLDKFNFGIEYAFMNILSIRSGYRFNYDEEGLTLGAGINYDIIDLKLKVDYAFIDAGLFKQVHMISLGMCF